MSNDTVVSLAAPARVCDPLTELLRTGARRLIEAAVTAEFEEYLSGFAQEKLPDGRQRVVRNGHLPERKILTGLGDPGSRSQEKIPVRACSCGALRSLGRAPRDSFQFRSQSYSTCPFGEGNLRSSPSRRRTVHEPSEARGSRPEGA